MEPRCNHLGNGVTPVSSRTQLPPQWSPGVITWETPFVIAFIRSPNAPQWSPGVITWETPRLNSGQIAGDCRSHSRGAVQMARKLRPMAVTATDRRHTRHFCCEGPRGP